MLIPLRVNGQNASVKKRKILELLESQGIETRPVLTGNFLSQPAMNRIDGNHRPASEFPIAKISLAVPYDSLSDVNNIPRLLKFETS